MIDIKKLAYNIKSSNTSLRKMNGVLDNRLIMNQCKCMHHDGNGGVPLSALDEEELKKVPTPGVGIWKKCAICGKYVRIDRVSDDEVLKACYILDAYIDQQKMMMNMNNSTEEQVEILSGLQTDYKYTARMNKVTRNRSEKKKKNAQESQHKSNSGWNMNGVGGWHE